MASPPGAISRRGIRSGFGVIESARAKCVISLTVIPAGQERPARSSHSISERNNFSLMTGCAQPADGGERARAQAAISFREPAPASNLRPKSELVLVRSITTRTISPI